MQKLSRILGDYAKIEDMLPIEDCTEELGSLLRFDLNLEQPIHRWYNFKEGFSSGLVDYLIDNFFDARQNRSIAFLDPFCGVGTSLLAAGRRFDELGVRRIILRGIEVNPYIEFVAATKLGWYRYKPDLLLKAADLAMNGSRLRRRLELPALSTLRNEKFVSRNRLAKLLLLREKARSLSKGRPERKPLLLGLAAAAERVINLRKDGRALRYLPREGIPSTQRAVAERWREFAEDIAVARSNGSYPETKVDWRTIRGDGRRPDKIFDRKFDVILFSPPYLNNIDYTEVYKIELWLLEFLASPAQMREQRRRTFRSHPSCVFPEYDDARIEEVREVLGRPFQRLLEYAAAEEPWRRNLFAQYFADMLRTLRGCRRLLKQDGRVFLVVGNSLHGSSDHPIPVATDLWTCKLAAEANLRVERLLMGRQFARKKFHAPLLRESVIVMSKS